MPEGKANDRQTPKFCNVMSGNAKCCEKKIKQVLEQRVLEDGRYFR